MNPTTCKMCLAIDRSYVPDWPSAYSTLDADWSLKKSHKSVCPNSLHSICTRGFESGDVSVRLAFDGDSYVHGHAKSSLRSNELFTIAVLNP